MSVNHHTAIAVKAAANAATFNGPMGQLDQAITDLLAGDEAFSALALAAATELTIAAGVITPTQVLHTVDTQADAATDDLDTITGAVDTSLLVLRAANTARTVVVKHGTGNIYLFGGDDISIEDTETIIVLFRFGTNWYGVGGGGGGGTADATYITQTPHADLTAEQALSALATGILKSTTGTGVVTIATADDLPEFNANQILQTRVFG